jgi:hypothetical protein
LSVVYIINNDRLLYLKIEYIWLFKGVILTFSQEACMKQKYLLIASLVLGMFAFTSAQQIANVTFKDLSGKSYDLYTLLAEGKYVLVHCMFNTWSYCPGSVPALNTTWKTYGCTKCDKYSVLVIDANVASSDTKTAFQNYITNNKVQYPGVLCGDGGSAFDKALKNQGYGNPEYWIRPDKTYFPHDIETEDLDVNAEIKKAGLTPHVCAVPVQEARRSIASEKIAIHSLAGGMLSVEVRKSDAYTIEAFSTDGRLLSAVRSNLKAGRNLVALTSVSGIVIVTVKNAGERVSRKLVGIR